MLESTTLDWIGGRVTGVYERGHRQWLMTSDITGRTLYTPLLRGQFVTALTSYEALRPLPVRQLKVRPFLLLDTGRIVWPSGPYRRHLVPYGAIVVRVMCFCLPALLALAVHLTNTPIAPCP